MPLHVEVRVNKNRIGTLHIGRTESLLDKNQTSGYLVTADAEGEYITLGDQFSDNVDYLVDWSDGVPFAHKYSDGALVCVQKGIEAFLADGRSL